MTVAHDLKDGWKAITNVEGWPKYGDLQDGMLEYYLSQAPASDVNVERRVHNKEPFDLRDFMTFPWNEK